MSTLIRLKRKQFHLTHLDIFAENAQMYAFPIN